MSWASRLADCRSRSDCRRPSSRGSRSAVLTHVVREARSRLELICDTYLSVSTPLQDALGDLLARGQAVREQIQSRGSPPIIARCNPPADRCRRATSFEPTAAGMLFFRVPSLMSEDDLVLSLLSEDRRTRAPRILLRLSARVVSDRQPADACGRYFSEGASRILDPLRIGPRPAMTVAGASRGTAHSAVFLPIDAQLGHRRHRRRRAGCGVARRRGHAGAAAAAAQRDGAGRAVARTQR